MKKGEIFPFFDKKIVSKRYFWNCRASHSNPERTRSVSTRRFDAELIVRHYTGRGRLPAAVEPPRTGPLFLFLSISAIFISRDNKSAIAR